MSDRSPETELRRSVALLATEWWLIPGGVAAYLLYGVWVVATGLALTTVTPSFATAAVATVGTTTVTGLLVLAAVAWLLVPAVAVAWLLDRRLSNVNGNLVSRYRIDHPGVLPAPSGVCVAVGGGAALVLGPRAPVLAVMTIASVHLLVRTLAFGRRVYSFSPRPLFPALSAASALALAAAWLVHAHLFTGGVGRRLTSAGVPVVVETGLGSTPPGTALGVLVAVPALLSGGYLAVQSVVASLVRLRAPLENPVKRAEQRYPIMPPVSDSSRPGPPSNNGSSAADDPPTTSSGSQSTNGGVSTDGDRSQTRVFRSQDATPDDDQTTAGTGDAADDWADDTAVYSPNKVGGPDETCGDCDASIPDDSMTFCPNCGERIRR